MVVGPDGEPELRELGYTRRRSTTAPRSSIISAFFASEEPKSEIMIRGPSRTLPARRPFLPRQERASTTRLAMEVSICRQTVSGSEPGRGGGGQVGSGCCSACLLVPKLWRLAAIARLVQPAPVRRALLLQPLAPLVGCHALLVGLRFAVAPEVQCWVPRGSAGLGRPQLTPFVAVVAPACPFRIEHVQDLLAVAAIGLLGKAKML